MLYPAHISSPLRLSTHAFTCCALLISSALFHVTPSSAFAAPEKTQSALAKTTTATAFMKLRVAQVLKLAALPTPNAKVKAKVDAQLLTLIKPMMDFPAMSQASLGKHWGARSTAERAQFIALFEELVFHSYIKKIRSADSTYRVEYEDETKTASGATVEAVAITSQQEIELRFELKRHEREGLVLYVANDVVIDEVSLVQNYREQFNKIITKDGFGALLKKMERQIAKVK